MGQTLSAPALHSTEAEQAVLGSILTTPSVLADVDAILRPTDFWRGEHQEIYETILRLVDDGRPVSETAVVTDLRRRKVLDRCGGPGYIVTLMQRAAPTHVRYFAQIVREEAGKRRLHTYLLECLQRLQDGSAHDLETLLSYTQEGLDAVAGDQPGRDVVPLADSLTSTVATIEELGRRGRGTTGVPTGFVDLDKLIGGLHPGQMIVIAARPGVGKSTLGLDFARSAAIKHKKPTLIFSMEMSHEEITMRLLSAEAKVLFNKIRSGDLAEEDWNLLSRTMPRLTQAPLFIDDTPNITPTQLRAKARRIKQRFGLDLIIVDYLQLMSSGARFNSRQEEVSQLSRQMKLLAKELEVPVVVISQLNRNSEQRLDKRPQVSDLRESGSIEQDADVIILLFREDAVDPESPRMGEADLIIGKQRNGPTGIVTVSFQGHYARFADMAVFGDIPFASPLEDISG